MDCEETGLETVDFGTFATTLTPSNTDDADVDVNADGNNTLATLEMMLHNTALTKDQIQAILAASKTETTGKNEISGNGKDETQRNDNNADDKKSKLAKITPTKQSKQNRKTLTRNGFPITKHETRSMKRDAIKNNEDSKIPGITKITPKKTTINDKEKNMDSTSTNNTDDDDAMDSDDVSDVFDTPLTLKHSSNVIFSNIDVVFNNNDADVSFNNSKAENRIIPSLKIRLAKATPLTDSSLQKATCIIPQVPTFTSKLDEHDTQGWEQVERPKCRKSAKTPQPRQN